MSNVVDHDGGRLVWPAPRRERATLTGFIDALDASGAGRCQALTHGRAMARTGRSRRRPARPAGGDGADPFHAVAWASHASTWSDASLEQARHRPGGTVRADRRAGLHYNMSRGDAETIQRYRWALWMNPDRTSAKCLDRKTAAGYRAWLPGWSAVRVQGQGDRVEQALDRWLAGPNAAGSGVVDLGRGPNATWSRSTPPRALTGNAPMNRPDSPHADGLWLKTTTPDRTGNATWAATVHYRPSISRRVTAG